jgi:hypothetical protein
VATVGSALRRRCAAVACTRTSNPHGAAPARKRERDPTRSGRACGSRSWPQAPRLGAVALRWPSGLRLKSCPQGSAQRDMLLPSGHQSACCPERQRPSRRRSSPGCCCSRPVLPSRDRAHDGHAFAWTARAELGAIRPLRVVDCYRARGIERTATDPPLMRSTMLNRRPPPTTAPGRRRGPMYRCTGLSHSAQRRGLEVPRRRCVVRRPSSARYRGDLRYEHADLLVEAVGTCPVRRAGTTGLRRHGARRDCQARRRRRSWRGAMTHTASVGRGFLGAGAVAARGDRTAHEPPPPAVIAEALSSAARGPVARGARVRLARDEQRRPQPVRSAPARSSASSASATMALTMSAAGRTSRISPADCPVNGVNSCGRPS